MKYLLLLLLAAPFSMGEEACFDKVDAPDFVAPVVEPRYRVIKRCRTWGCVKKRARKSRKVMQVFIHPRARGPRAHWGNLGWARHNMALVREESQVEAVLLMARGVENHEVGTAPAWVIDFALEDHDRFVAEVKCLRKIGRGLRSFNEVQRVL